jgi:hypothetical protein
MTPMTEMEYETMLHHLTEQLSQAAFEQAARTADDEWLRDQLRKSACDALANTWTEDLTPREWLDAAARRLNVDASECVGV